MTNASRHFSLTEAEALLPEVGERMQRIQTLKKNVDAKISTWEEGVSRAAGEPSPVEEALVKAQVDFIVSQINRELEAVQATGAQPKDIDLGLVDFPAMLHGREVLLCWKVGEIRIDHWHAPSEGFRNRKPLIRSLLG